MTFEQEIFNIMLASLNWQLNSRASSHTLQTTSVKDGMFYSFPKMIKCFGWAYLENAISAKCPVAKICRLTERRNVEEAVAFGSAIPPLSY